MPEAVPKGWSLARGATCLPGGGARFAMWAPAARDVRVRILGDGGGEVPLARDDAGVFAATVASAPVGADYVYVLGDRERPDPVSRHQPHGVHGPSRLVDPEAFVWSDASWRGREMADLVLYELHVGTFTDAGTFDAVVPRLPELRDLGITAIELMPIAEFPGGRNWGYDGVALYAPQSTYGGPDGLRRLVDAAHAEGLAVALDVVYNHLGPEGNYLGELGPYFTDRYRTPWGLALNYDGPDSDEVRRWVVDNARYWITEFHVDVLRLDAVHAICDWSARHLLEEIAAAVHETAAERGRRALVVAESDLNDPRLVRPVARGGYGLDGQWSDDFHHAVHARLTGERSGYYVDFGAPAAVAKALRDRFVYDGAYSHHRRRRHGAPATDVPSDRFVVFVQNHDQVGNRAQGERLGSLVSFERQKLAASLLLLSPYVPLLFMGEEYGETHPFQYFVSHGDPELARAVREGRQREFASFGWAGDVPDPQGEETFRRSRLDRALASTTQGRQLRALHRDLLALRRTRLGLRPGVGVFDVVADGAGRCLTTEMRAPGGRPLRAVFNLSSEPAAVEVEPAEWALLLASDAPCYGGPGTAGVAADGLALPGWAAVLLENLS